MFLVGIVNLICLLNHHHQISGNLLALAALLRKKIKIKIFRSNDTEKYLSQVAIKICAGEKPRRKKIVVLLR